MRMIAAILDCPFHLSIMSEAPVQPRSTAALEKAAIARTDAVEKKQAEEIQTEKNADRRASAGEYGSSGVRRQSAGGRSGCREYGGSRCCREDIRRECVRRACTRREYIGEDIAADERDMTIGELYEIHEELSELEKSAKAGEPVEEIKKELEKPKKSLFHTGGIFLRRKQRETAAADHAGAAKAAETVETASEDCG